MRSLTPSAEKICTVAVEQFAAFGYDAASLNDIAVASGLRKPSLYAHFSSKDDLFEAVLECALAAERAHIEACFAEPEPTLPGARYSHTLGERYAASAHLRFLLRSAFFPPAPLRPLISAGFEDYLARLGELFEQQLTETDVLSRQRCRDAYMGIVDSLSVELIYAGQAAYRRRLEALWWMFEGALGQA
ncbi:TetR family transcriptional regulator [Pseudomonas sp. SDI]|uniref:TetR/AcrR family transcriptional regulator n=1 Tax=Pseudomonas sp. SDI TaxID=2170734 RepID=UPI000DE67310|nr:TetR/AcrR family transcriptional regulator [Pseudomonas sp. SDI]PWB31444.1 TetR family transcriptional regulator [Pseudomonas sp. SDI]